MEHFRKNHEINIDHIRHTIVRDNDIRFAEFELGGEEKNMPLPAQPEMNGKNRRSGDGAWQAGQAGHAKAELSLTDLNFWDEKETAGSAAPGNVPDSKTDSRGDSQSSAYTPIPGGSSYDGVRYYSREQQFVLKARELAWHVEPEQPFVPFKSYWPTYEQMTSGQYKWYFYWREEVRCGRYPDSDLSYLFVYMYELINGIGWSNPAQGYQLLSSVWKAYRERYPKLDGYAREWLYDFSLIHGLDMPVTEAYSRIPRSLSSELKELEWLRIFSAQPLMLNWDLLSDLMDYEPNKSRFYQEGGRKDMRTFGPKVIALVDSYYGKTKGQRLLERFRPRERSSERYVFRSAVYDYDLYGRTVSLMKLPISSHPPLRNYITQLIRMMENKLRELRGFKGRLRGIEIEPEIEELVARFLKREIELSTVSTEKANKPKVKIDRAKLRQLQRESDDVRDMLLMEEPVAESDNGRASLDPVAETGNERAISEPGTVKKAKKAHKLQDQIGPLQMDMFDISQAVDDLEDGMESGMTGGLERESEQRLAMDLSLDARDAENRANEDSAPFGSADQEAEQAGSGSDELKDEPSSGIGLIWHTDQLDEEWRELASQLGPVHLEVLYALKSGANMAELHAVAEAAGSMPALLIDEINDAAMETIGDLLIDGETLVDEYRMMLDPLMR
ncbi:TerB N-terminal domain-containing protein [Paenibacillus dakarensis]|uniref:TerB N-terminal domain-containing protein n=1 Tax=Paenibacillus dakarensis TaxID=1527293 RepID=UPI0006D53762|nr:TerB N-terminal domain-containing protein [Paenibacillus dakarensis]